MAPGRVGFEDEKAMGKMWESSETCLVHRVKGYPVVSAVLGAAGAGLEVAKGQGYGVGAAVGWAEWAGEKGLGLGSKLMETSAGERLNKALGSRLPAFEAAVPAVTMNGSEFRKEYYEGSKIASLFDLMAGGATMAAGFVEKSKDFVGKGKDFVEKGKDFVQAQNISGAIHNSIAVLDGLLERTEHFVDARIGGKEHDYAQASSSTATSLPTRLANILTKTWTHMRPNLSFTAPTMPTMTDIRSRADSASVATLKALVNVAALVSDKGLEYCPRLIYTPAKGLHHYVQDWEGKVGEAESLADVRNEVWSELKSGKELAESTFLNTMDRISDTPPLSWITAPSTPAETEMELKETPKRSSPAPTFYSPPN